jgi:hypothetical protein
MTRLWGIRAGLKAWVDAIKAGQPILLSSDPAESSERMDSTLIEGVGVGVIWGIVKPDIAERDT